MKTSNAVALAIGSGLACAPAAFAATEINNSHGYQLTVTPTAEGDAAYNAPRIGLSR